jgi:hypothetical protein
LIYTPVQAGSGELGAGSRESEFIFWLSTLNSRHSAAAALAPCADVVAQTASGELGLEGAKNLSPSRET